MKTAVIGLAALMAALASADTSWQGVNDYTALFIKQEINKEGQLGKPEEIYLKFSKPFKIYMAWLNTDKKGLHVLYERGKHDGKLGIHKPGLFFGLKQVIFLPQDSPWVREGSQSFDIEDAGIGTFLTEFTNAVKRGQAEGKIEITQDGDLFDVRFPGSVKNEDYFAQRIKVRFGPGGLPVYQELYGWDGRLEGIYEYRDVKPNVGEAPDTDFRNRAHRILYRIYDAK